MRVRTVKRDDESGVDRIEHADMLIKKYNEAIGRCDNNAASAGLKHSHYVVTFKARNKDIKMPLGGFRHKSFGLDIVDGGESDSGIQWITVIIPKEYKDYMHGRFRTYRNEDKRNSVEPRHKDWAESIGDII